MGVWSRFGATVGPTGLVVAALVVLPPMTAASAAGGAASAWTAATPVAAPLRDGEDGAALGRRVVAAVEVAGTYRFDRYEVSGGERRPVRSGAVALGRGARSDVAGTGMVVQEVAGRRYVRAADGSWTVGPASELDPLLRVLDELAREVGGWERVAVGTIDGVATEVLRTTEPVALAETTAEERTLWVDAETALPLRFRERGAGPIGPYELETEFRGFGEPVDLDLPPAALALGPVAATPAAGGG